MVRQRVRIRFQKEGDLRLIGHRDLLRAMEQSFCRAGVQLALPQGYHPKAKLSFPLALAVGIVGNDEVREVEFSEVVNVDTMTPLLRDAFPPGLTLVNLESMPPDAAKAHVARVTFRIHIPEPLRDQVARSLDEFNGRKDYWVERLSQDRPKLIDLKCNLGRLELIDSHLHVEQSTSRDALATPREILAALGIDQIESDGSLLTRTHVDLVAN